METQSKRLTMDHYKENQALIPIATLFSDITSLLEKIKYNIFTGENQCDPCHLDGLKCSSWISSLSITYKLIKYAHS